MVMLITRVFARKYMSELCRFIRSVSQIFLLANSNRKRYFHNALKPIKRCSMFSYGSPFLISSMWYQLTRRYVHGYRHSEESVLLHPSLQHPLKDWQDRRCKKLTASTFGQAIGLFPKRRVQLWLEKLELGVTFRPNLAICWGNIKEEEALKRYEFITGNCVPEPPRFVVYDEENHKNNWLAASPDRLLDWENGGVLEIKCPCVKEGKDRYKVLPWKRIPLYYMPQAQGLLEITNREWMDFFVWTINGSSLFRVHRDEEYWEKIKDALSDFWMNHVVPAREICEELKKTKSLDLKNLDLNALDLNNLDPRLCKLQPEERHESCVDIVRESELLVDRRSELLFREVEGKLKSPKLYMG